MADKPKTWRDTVSDAADSAITWARDKANVPDDIEGFEDYLLNTRSSPDDVSWGNPYFKEDPENPGRITPTRRPRSPGGGRPHYPHRPPSSKEIADFDKQEQHELLDDIRGIGSIADLRKIAKDLNVDVSDVSSLPRTVIRNLLREHGPSSRPSEDKQIHAGWEIDPATGQRKPKMVEFDHARKKAARKAWDKHKFKEDYAEGLRLHNEEERLKRATYANKRPDPKSDIQRGPGPDSAWKRRYDPAYDRWSGVYQDAPEKGYLQRKPGIKLIDGTIIGGGEKWVKGKDEVLKDLQKQNEANVTEGGAGLSDVHPRVERD